MNDNNSNILRYDTMSLSTLNKNDTNFNQFKKLDTDRKWSMNLCNKDIASILN
jgi:hypothetical protein